MLGPEQRRRADAVRSTTSPASPTPHESPKLAMIDTVAAACRDQVRLSFDYVSGDGTGTQRYVEPCQLVSVDARWYLVAYDANRSDWRTFRLDRMCDATSGRNSFTPRPAPASDLVEYVRFNMSEPAPSHEVIVDIELPAADVLDAYGTWANVVATAKHRCRLSMQTSTFEWPTHIIATLDAPTWVISPTEFKDHLVAVAKRAHTSATGLT